MASKLFPAHARSSANRGFWGPMENTYIGKLSLTRYLVGLFVLGLAACISDCSAARQIASATTGPASSPQFSHVILVVEENHSYNEVIGNPGMPYLNSLASSYGLATQYYADLHPSIPNYFMLTTGTTVTIDDAFTGTVSSDNVVNELTAAGKSWKSYAESLPSPGYLGGDVYPYLKHHNPFAYFTAVTQHPTQAANLVPFTQFSADLTAGKVPNFSFVTPNVLDDAHDGTLTQADDWLKTNIAPLINSPQFQTDGLLIITFDEGDNSDFAHGGGHVATVVVSPKAKRKYQSTTYYEHSSVLREVLESLGASNFPGASAVSPDMGEFFQ